MTNYIFTFIFNVLLCICKYSNILGWGDDKPGDVCRKDTNCGTELCRTRTGRPVPPAKFGFCCQRTNYDKLAQSLRCTKDSHCCLYEPQPQDKPWCYDGGCYTRLH